MPSRPSDPARLARLEIICLRYPLARPMDTVMGRLESRPALLIRLEDGSGAEGWGEVWCNFPKPGAEYRAELAAATLEHGLAAVDPSAPAEAFVALRKRLHLLALQAGEGGPADQIASGVDIALHDLAARKAGVSLAAFLGGAPRALESYASGIDSRLAADMVAKARDDGFSTFKLRVGFGHDSDAEVLRTCGDLIGKGEVLAVDANQNWSLAGIRDLAGLINETPLAWVEEPLPVDRPLSEWIAAADALAHPIAGGENMRSSAEFDAAIAGPVFGVIQPDVCKWGGLSGCLDIARRVIAAGKRYCPHYLGGGLGLVASAHLLSAAGGDGLLEIDVNDNALRERLAGSLLPLREGRAITPDGPGLGVTPDCDLIRDYQVSHFDIKLRN
ncbi:MAG: mandelate racemase/muconate lactonizing enzyme family protein [Geminicoccaceae bacterium]